MGIGCAWTAGSGTVAADCTNTGGDGAGAGCTTLTPVGCATGTNGVACTTGGAGSTGTNGFGST